MVSRDSVMDELDDLLINGDARCVRGEKERESGGGFEKERHVSGDGEVSER